MARRRGVPMRPGECRTTVKGVRYCFGPKGVRFVGSIRTGRFAGYGFDEADLAYEGFGRVAMRPGECRTTRAGVRYCYTPRGVRFQRG